MTTVIAFVSQKGGVGKSTLSRALAREAAASGLAVKIADLDTQQSTSVDWHRQRLDIAGFHGSVEPGDQQRQRLVMDFAARRSAAVSSG